MSLFLIYRYILIKGTGRINAKQVFYADFFIEKELLREGYRCIAGIDEAGRGALAGPLE